MIYFVQGESGGDIKIGTTVRLAARISGIKPRDGARPTVLGIVDGGRDREGELHARFSHLRVEGEWFAPGADLLAFIEAESRPWTPDDDRPLTEPPLRQRSGREAGDGPAILRGLLRLGWAEYKPHSSHLSALVKARTGETISRQRISKLVNAVRVDDETVALLAKAIGVKPEELLKE